MVLAMQSLERRSRSRNDRPRSPVHGHQTSIRGGRMKKAPSRPNAIRLGFPQKSSRSASAALLAAAVRGGRAVRRGGGFIAGHAFEFADLVAQEGGFFEFEVVCGCDHFFFEFANGFGHIEVLAA